MSIQLTPLGTLALVMGESITLASCPWLNRIQTVAKGKLENEVVHFEVHEVG